jgi:HEAT repeat
MSNDETKTMPGAFQDVIRNSGPQICELFMDSDWSIRSAGANTICRLAEHGM